MFPVHQENAEQPGGDGHWFTIVVNLDAKEFQVIDSLRNPNNEELQSKATQTRVKIITLWRKFTAKHKGCKVPTIYTFRLQYVEGYKQIGM